MTAKKAPAKTTPAKKAPTPETVVVPDEPEFPVSEALMVFDIPLGKIQPYPKNPRKNEAGIEKVAQSIKDFGFRQPLVVDSNYVIIVGHTRFYAAKDMGLKTVPVHVADISESKARAYRLADNKTAEYSEWDFELLAGEIAAIEQAGEIEIDWLDFDVELPSEDAPVMEDEEENDPEDAPDVPDEAVTQPGDLVIMGDHRLICGDSTDGEVWDALMQGQQAHLLLTDPPYGVSYVGKTKDALTIENDQMTDDQLREWLNKFMGNAFNVLVSGGSYYIWHADSEGYAFRGALKDNGITLRQSLIWVKDVMVLGRQDYHWQHEPCLYGWKDGESHRWFSDRTQTTTLRYDRPKRSTSHPTMKPIEMFSYLIGNSTQASELVIDPFLGSGTTLIAAQRLGRRCYGIELSPKYCDVIVQRWEKYSGQKAERVSLL